MPNDVNRTLNDHSNVRIKLPGGVLALIVIGILAGLYQLLFSIFGFDVYGLWAGGYCIVLSLLLFSLKDWVRIAMIGCCLINLALNYVPVILAAFTIDPFYGIACISYLPTAAFSFLCIVYLNLRKVKVKFKGYREDAGERAGRAYVIFWRAYFCFLAFLLIPSFFSSLSKPFQRADLIIALIAMIGLFGFAWQMKILPSLWWKIFALAYPIWNIYYEFFIQYVSPEEAGRLGNVSLFMVHALAFVKILPLMIALYLYGFKKQIEIKGDGSI